ncbi:MAG: DUF305 domain-containing protein [Gemmatimonadota bacterium]
MPSTSHHPDPGVKRGRGVVVGILLASLLSVVASPATAQNQHSMAGMGDHPRIAIPPGALYTVADVTFLQGMIAHHAQAIHMSRMAARHQANAAVQRLAIKIEQSQVAEINIMQEWLARNGQFVPDTASWHTMQMSGMLTAAELQELDAASAGAFDRTYLTLMIQHHEGALEMVRDLFATAGAAQDVDVSVFANDVVTVQTAEIGAMRQMLSQLADQ